MVFSFLKLSYFFLGGIRGHPSIYSGLLILSGLIVFVITEKIFSVITKLTEQENEHDTNSLEKINNNVKGYCCDEEIKENNKKHVGFG